MGVACSRCGRDADLRSPRWALTEPLRLWSVYYDRDSTATGKTGRDHGTRFGGKQCPLLRSARVSAGLRCIFIADSAQTVVRHLESVRSPRFSRHCTVLTPRITVPKIIILRTGSVRMLETAKRSPVSNGLDDALMERHQYQKSGVDL